MFLLALGLDAFDTLMYWSRSIKEQFLEGAVHIFYCLKFSVYIAAPMLFFYVKSMVDTHFRFGLRDSIHFLPLAIFPFFILLLYSSFTPEERALAIIHYGLLFDNPVFQLHLWVRHLLYVGYGIGCLYLLSQYKNHLKQHFSNIEKIDLFWLRLLIGGFLMIWVWVFIAYVLTLMNTSQWIGDMIGISGNFFNFVFVNALVLYSMAYATIGYRRIIIDKPREQEKSDPATLGKINYLMEEKELYLDPEFTLEQLAAISDIPVRKISVAINRYAEQNFFDYINAFRVKKAAEILADLKVTKTPISMLDVMTDAGFNSKSTFNRAFKKTMQMTPTEYLETRN